MESSHRTSYRYWVPLLLPYNSLSSSSPLPSPTLPPPHSTHPSAFHICGSSSLQQEEKRHPRPLIGLCADPSSSHPFFFFPFFILCMHGTLPRGSVAVSLSKVCVRLELHSMPSSPCTQLSLACRPASTTQKNRNKEVKSAMERKRKPLDIAQKLDVFLLLLTVRITTARFSRDRHVCIHVHSCHSAKVERACRAYSVCTCMYSTNASLQSVRSTDLHASSSS